MKCPTCKTKISPYSNRIENKDKKMYLCPNCSTTFEIHSSEKLFPKGMIILILSNIVLDFLPDVAGVVIFMIILFFVIRWAYKPENVYIGNKNVKNT